jgi:hypothetical protein
MHVILENPARVDFRYMGGLALFPPRSRVSIT